ncbi:MAG: YbaK/EbsC family protein [Geminicoccaceae bacterium]|nr:YbaK/EbsC family protein [Geminicoccaceae bacterium]
MSLLEREPVRRVQAALEAAGSTSRVIELQATARTAEDAARACGVDVGAIVKSLVFSHDGQAVMALVAGDRRCDMQALKQALGLSGEPGRADPDLVKRQTGFTIGGVAPCGHLTPVPAAIDPDLARFERLFAAAGHPHCVFATDFDELRRISSAVEMRSAGQG